MSQFNISQCCFCQDSALIRAYLSRWTRAWHPPVWTWPGCHLVDSVKSILTPANVLTSWGTIPNPQRPFRLTFILQVYGLVVLTVRCWHTSTTWWRVETDPSHTSIRIEWSRKAWRRHSHFCLKSSTLHHSWPVSVIRNKNISRTHLFWVRNKKNRLDYSGAYKQKVLFFPSLLDWIILRQLNNSSSDRKKDTMPYMTLINLTIQFYLSRPLVPNP